MIGSTRTRGLIVRKSSAVPRGFLIERSQLRAQIDCIVVCNFLPVPGRHFRTQTMRFLSRCVHEIEPPPATPRSVPAIHENKNLPTVQTAWELRLDHFKESVI